MDENKEREVSEEKEKKEKMQNQNQSVEAQRKGLIARIAGVAVSALSLIRETARTLLFGASYAKRTRDELGEKMDAVKNSAEKMQMNKIHKNTPETDLEMAKTRNMQNLAEELMKDKENTQMAETETKQEEPEESKDAREEEDSVEETMEEADKDTEETEMQQEEIEEEEVFQIEDEFQRNADIAKKMEADISSHDGPKIKVPEYAEKIRQEVLEAIKEDWYKKGTGYSQEKKDEILAWVAQPATKQGTYIDVYTYSNSDNVSPEIAKYLNQSKEMQEARVRFATGVMMHKERTLAEVEAMEDSIKKAIELDSKQNIYPSKIETIISMSDDIYKMDSMLDKMMGEVEAGNLLPSADLLYEIEKLTSECKSLDGFTAEELWDAAVDAYMSGSENMKDDVMASVFFEPATDADFQELMDESEQEEEQQEENEQEERVNDACDAEELDR